MINNKGQSLVLFIVVLPILLLIFVLVIDVGRAIILRQELDNINKIVLDYGLDHMDNTNLNDEMINLVKLNNDTIDDVSIRLENEKLYLVLSTDVDGIFLNLINVSAFDVYSSYVGYIENNEKIIKRISG